MTRTVNEQRLNTLNEIVKNLVTLATLATEEDGIAKSIPMLLSLAMETVGRETETAATEKVKESGKPSYDGYEVETTCFGTFENDGNSKYAVRVKNGKYSALFWSNGDDELHSNQMVECVNPSGSMFRCYGDTLQQALGYGGTRKDRLGQVNGIKEFQKTCEGIPVRFKIGGKLTYTV